LFKITTCLNNIFGLLNNMLGHAWANGAPV
jgi:hypothetical protein